MQIHLAGSSEMTLEEVQQKLGYNDSRSTINWCERNKVVVIKEGKEKQVNRTQFLLAFYQKLIEQLKTDHPENWLQMFQAYMNADYESALSLNHQEPKITNTKRHNSKGNQNYRFMQED